VAQSRPPSAPASAPASSRLFSAGANTPLSSPKAAFVGSPDMYRHEKVLGKGAFGLVSLVRSVLTGELVAMKTIDRSKLYTHNLKKTVEQEIRILKLLRHERIISLYEIIETPRAIHLVMEYSDGGNLHEHTKRHKRMEESMAQRLFLQLLEAVKHCHTQRVCHRDLKLENFVLDKGQSTLKLIDFGLSVVWADGKGELFKSYGTPCYTAPEIIGGKRYLGPQVDVWSLGVSLSTMLTGALPFQAIGASELNRRILRGQFMLPDWLSSEAADLIRQMLTLSPERRITLDDIFEHPWLQGVAEKESRLAARQEASRAGVDAASPRAEGAGEEPDAAILKQVEQLGFSAEAVSQSVRAKAYDHAAALYHMLQRKAAVAKCKPSC